MCQQGQMEANNNQQTFQILGGFFWFYCSAILFVLRLLVICFLWAILRDEGCLDKAVGSNRRTSC